MGGFWMMVQGVGMGGSPTATIVGACWAAGEVYHPGMKAAEVYKPGVKAGQEVC